MKKLCVLAVVAALLTGCATHEVKRIEWYPPSSPDEIRDGHGPLKEIEWEDGGFIRFSKSLI